MENVSPQISERIPSQELKQNDTLTYYFSL